MRAGQTDRSRGNPFIQYDNESAEKIHELLPEFQKRMQLDQMTRAYNNKERSADANR